MRRRRVVELERIFGCISFSEDLAGELFEDSVEGISAVAEEKPLCLLVVVKKGGELVIQKMVCWLTAGDKVSGCL